MKINIAAFFPLLLILAVPAFGDTTNSWDKAVRFYSENAELRPHRMEITSKTFNGKGELEKTEEQIFRLSYISGEESPLRELIMATEDGADVTAEKRKEIENGQEGSGPGRDSEGMDKHPLDPEVQDDIISSYSGKTEYKNGRRCEIWDFKIRLNEKYSGIGKIWLNQERGEAVSLEYSIDPLFPFVEEMSIGMDFRINESEQWIMDRLKMNGRINMIIVKKTFDAITSFSDYR